MTRNNDTTENEADNKVESTTPDKVAIEGNLPLTAVDIESQKDMMAKRSHPLRTVHKWFAARPTPAVRLAILASTYPGEIDSDELLNLMQIGPKERNKNIAEYIKSQFDENNHFDDTNQNTQTPTQNELENLHDEVRKGWGGESPTILDPTCGRGIIPFEAIRYGYPAVATELNPIPALISKVGLEYAPKLGSITPEIYEWRDKIHDKAKQNISKYYPTEEKGREILNCAFTYLIECDYHGGEIPLVSKWHLSKTGDGDVIIPHYEEGEVTYEHCKANEVPDGYNPSNAPLMRGGVECPHCGGSMSNEDIREKIKNGEFEYSIYGVSYQTPDGEYEFRAGKNIDTESMEKAAERVESDFDMMDFLSEPIPSGKKTDEMRNYGMEQWRDILTPRQLVTNYEYLKAFDHYKEEIKQKYDPKKAELILIILSLISSRSLSFNTRLTKWTDKAGAPMSIFTDNNFALKKMAGDNNLSTSRKGWVKRSDQIIDSYEKIAEYSQNSSPAEVWQHDASNISGVQKEGSIDVAIVDPPYYSSIMYSELSDVFYVVLKQYLQDTFPEMFNSKLTDKDNEAVANTSRFESVADSNSSMKKMADEYYEEKMLDIFNETRRSLTDGGVMTVMFTHREMDAWDTLTSALIESGFVITATHPIKTEKGDRIGVRGADSADSSIFLTARKRSKQGSSSSSLWSDIEDKIYSTAKEEAKEIINSEYQISKTDTAIAAYGPTLKEFVKAHPVVDKNGNELRPREALSEARQAVTSVLVEEYLNVNGVDTIDSLTRWYILIWLIYENDTVITDEARQVGRAADIDIRDVDARSDTKIWGKSGGDLQLKDPSERVQDIVKLESEEADNPSSNKYPVDPTKKSFQNAIDAVHAAVHVYDREGSDRALQWLKERNMDTETEFHITIIALLETMPSGNDIRGTLEKLVQGQTGEYLDIDLTTFSSTADPQTGVSEWIDDNE